VPAEVPAEVPEVPAVQIPTLPLDGSAMVEEFAAILGRQLAASDPEAAPLSIDKVVTVLFSTGVLQDRLMLLGSCDAATCKLLFQLVGMSPDPSTAYNAYKLLLAGCAGTQLASCEGMNAYKLLLAGVQALSWLHVKV
jgi:hypothetical protein